MLDKEKIIQDVKHLFSYELEDLGNVKGFPVREYMLYVQIPKHRKDILRYLKDHYRCEEHLNGKWWILEKGDSNG